MASIYSRGGIWWLKYRGASGAIVRESTGYRVSSGQQKRKAQELCAEKAFDESKTRAPSRHQSFDLWVPAFLAKRSPRYSTAWRTIKMFLEQRGITAPRNLTRGDCLAYFDWRKAPDKRKGKYSAGHNTALLEIKVLGIVMRESIWRGFATVNPCRELGIRRAAVREKSPFDLGTITIVQRHVYAMPESETQEFFRNSFEIARYQGCRLSETLLDPIADVDIHSDGRNVIRFRAKGGKIHAAPLHPALVPMFRKLKADGRTDTYKKPRSPAKMWFTFLKGIGVKQIDSGLCFHSWRVTVATELAKKNVHEAKARRYLGHASTTVHRIYQKLRVEDVRDVTDSLS